MYSTFLLMLLLTPLLLSIVAFYARGMGALGPKVAEVSQVLSITTKLVLTMAILYGVLLDGSVAALGNWLRVDALSAIFLLIDGVIGFLVGLYSISYIRHDRKIGLLDDGQVSTYYGFFNFFFLFTLPLMVASNNIILTWVAIEATTLGSSFLVGIYGRREALEAAWKYVILCTVGVAFALYGTILLYADAVNTMKVTSDAVLWTEIIKVAPQLDPTILKLSFVFILIGFGSKSGLFPMHAWLPDVHSEAPTPVSGMFSAVMVNCALYVIIRFAVITNLGVGPGFTQPLLIVFGAMSVIAGTFFLSRQRDIKRLLSYSTIENIGMIVLALGVGGPTGFIAALLHAVNHSLTKALMFCTAGNLRIKYGTRDLDKVKGLIQVAPFTSMLMILGAMSLAGSPPMNMFVSKFWIIANGIGAGHIWLMIAIILTLLIVFGTFFKLIGESVFGQAPAGIPKGDLPFGAQAPIAIMLILIILLGVYLPPQMGVLLSGADDIAMVGTPGYVASHTPNPNIFAPILRGLASTNYLFYPLTKQPALFAGGN